jgi:hypothetical protein
MELFILGTGLKMDLDMEEVFRSGRTALSTKAIGRMIWQMERVV